MKIALAAVAAALLCFAVVGLPSRPAPDAAPVPATGGELDKLAASVAVVVAKFSPADRAVWAEVWEKTSKAAAAEGTTEERLFVNTTGMRSFTIAALEVAWRRIQGVQPDQYPGLKKAVEDFLADPKVLGRDEITATDAVCKQYAEACLAIAYAGQKRG